MRADRPDPDREPGAAGFTLLEVCVSTLILAVVILAVVQSLTSVQKAMGAAEDRSLTGDQVRLGIEQIVQQVRSANYLYDPGTEYHAGATPAGPACASGAASNCVPQAPSGVAGGFSFRAYTQLDGSYNCVQWRIWQVSGTGQLQFRSWSPNNPNSTVQQWQTVASYIVNPTTVPAFVLDGAAQYGGRLIDISLLADYDPRSTSAGIATENSSVTGRDVEYDFPSTICSTVPPA